LSCAASLAVQKIIVEENLLENARTQGAYLARLLCERLQSPNALAAPFTFDVRGGGAFWSVEFDFTGPEAASVDLKGRVFAMDVQARCLANGLIVMGMTGCANLENTQGDHILLAPAYNVTREEIEAIVEIFVKSVEEVLRESLV
jgi:adenosylmethionine-8-amino-7-oxononanoate aminotransferase